MITPAHPAKEQLRGSLDQGRTPGQVRVEALDSTIVQRQDVILGRLDEPQTLQLVELLRFLFGEVPGLGPILATVVQFPDVIVEGEHWLEEERCGMAGHCAPTLMVDAAIAEHLEVLRFVPLRRLGVVEAVEHARSLERALLHTVDDGRLRDASRL
jgi:hypothetical protein